LFEGLFCSEKNAMKKVLKMFGGAAAMLLASANASFAADTPGCAPLYGTAIAAGLGAGLSIIGAGWGFGRIGAAALESMARQPEVKDDIGRNMIVIAALLEGATFFSLIVAMLLFFKS
jgi:F-type H+-transporting ATPase subunit c